MNELYDKVLKALQKEDKEAAVILSIDALRNKKVSVEYLYEMILSPALVSVVDEYKNDNDLIWREHVRSGIIRTIIECAYPYIIEEQKLTETKEEKAIVVCPEFEDHEIGAKMAADFFQIVGYETTFIGARTPLNTLLKAIEDVKPKYLVISVTNFYNLVSVKRMIDTIKEKASKELVYIVGGRAIQANSNTIGFLGADLELNNFSEIKQLSEGAYLNETSL